MKNYQVAFTKLRPKYPQNPPFHPSQAYPEYQFSSVGAKNDVYDQVRKIFKLLGMDSKNYGLESWNPLGELIKPGNTVVIKPNFVRHFHGGGLGLDSLITHGSIIRAVIDYTLIALRGRGRIIIGDSPLQQGQIDLVVQASGLDKIVEFVSKSNQVEFEIIDFRKEMAFKDTQGLVIGKKRLNGDPRGYAAVKLGRDSELIDIDEDYRKFRVTQYDPQAMIRHHHRGYHEYLIPKSVLAADVYINLPKLKTHRKAGITSSLKNLVGINGSKDWLPHHRAGSIAEGGDEYLYPDWRKSLMRVIVEHMDTSRSYQFVRFLSVLRRALHLSRELWPMRDPYLEGSWYGNDTLPRTITDLNKVILYADKNGKMKKTLQRKYFTLVDGVIGGEEEGPMEPTPKNSGVLLAGSSAVHVDQIGAEFMGFDWEKISSIRYAFRSRGYQLTPYSPVSTKVIIDKKILELDEFIKDYGMHFKPTLGWKGGIEKEDLENSKY